MVPIDGVPEGVAVLGASSPFAPASGTCDGGQAPLLLGPLGQQSGPYGAGWGEVAPAVISNGGAAASGTISQIHWTSWGGETATGKGLNPEYTPHGGYYRTPLVVELRASDVRRCVPNGRLVYTRLTEREQVRPGGAMGEWRTWVGDLCTGFR